MKMNIITALLLGAVIGSASAQSVGESRVPVSVKTAFTGKYAGAKQVKWDKEDGAWEASFDLNGQKQSAVFTANGTQTELETQIPVAKLPEAARTYIKSRKKTIREAAEITDAAGKKYYEAEAGGKDYLFNAEGKVVGKVGQ